MTRAELEAMDQEALDELVRECKDNEASAINQGGREAQIEYMLADNAPPECCYGMIAAGNQHSRDCKHYPWTLEDALDEYSVMDPPSLADAWKDTYADKPCPHPPGYWAVICDSGAEGQVVAYMATDKLALRFRLDLINRLLNG